MAQDAGYSGTPLAKKLGIKPGSDLSLDLEPLGWRVPRFGTPRALSRMDVNRNNAQSNALETFPIDQFTSATDSCDVRSGGLTRPTESQGERRRFWHRAA